MNYVFIFTCVNWLTNTGPGLLQAATSIPQYWHMVLSSPIGQYLAFAASQLTGSVGSSGTTGSSGSSGATGSWGSSGSGAGGPFKERESGLLSRTLD